MPGLVPGIHVLTHDKARGWPGQSPAMTKTSSEEIASFFILLCGKKIAHS
jgi:hypothetical protein